MTETIKQKPIEGDAVTSRLLLLAGQQRGNRLLEQTLRPFVTRLAQDADWEEASSGERDFAEACKAFVANRDRSMQEGPRQHDLASLFTLKLLANQESSTPSLRWHIFSRACTALGAPLKPIGVLDRLQSLIPAPAAPEAQDVKPKEISMWRDVLGGLTGDELPPPLEEKLRLQMAAYVLQYGSVEEKGTLLQKVLTAEEVTSLITLISQDRVLLWQTWRTLAGSVLLTTAQRKQLNVAILGNARQYGGWETDAKALSKHGEFPQQWGALSAEDQGYISRLIASTPAEGRASSAPQVVLPVETGSVDFAAVQTDPSSTASSPVLTSRASAGAASGSQTLEFQPAQPIVKTGISESVDEMLSELQALQRKPLGGVSVRFSPRQQAASAGSSEPSTFRKKFDVPEKRPSAFRFDRLALFELAQEVAEDLDLVDRLIQLLESSLKPAETISDLLDKSLVIELPSLTEIPYGQRAAYSALVASELRRSVDQLLPKQFSERNIETTIEELYQNWRQLSWQNSELSNSKLGLAKFLLERQLLFFKRGFFGGFFARMFFPTTYRILQKARADQEKNSETLEKTKIEQLKQLVNTLERLKKETGFDPGKQAFCLKKLEKKFFNYALQNRIWTSFFTSEKDQLSARYYKIFGKSQPLYEQSGILQPIDEQPGIATRLARGEFVSRKELEGFSRDEDDASLTANQDDILKRVVALMGGSLTAFGLTYLDSVVEYFRQSGSESSKEALLGVLAGGKESSDSTVRAVGDLYSTLLGFPSNPKQAKKAMTDLFTNQRARYLEELKTSGAHPELVAGARACVIGQMAEAAKALIEEFENKRDRFEGCEEEMPSDRAVLGILRVVAQVEEEKPLPAIMPDLAAASDSLNKRRLELLEVMKGVGQIEAELRKPVRKINVQVKEGGRCREETQALQAFTSEVIVLQRSEMLAKEKEEKAKALQKSQARVQQLIDQQKPKTASSTFAWKTAAPVTSSKGTPPQKRVVKKTTEQLESEQFLEGYKAAKSTVLSFINAWRIDNRVFERTFATESDMPRQYLFDQVHTCLSLDLRSSARELSDLVSKAKTGISEEERASIVGALSFLAAIPEEKPSLVTQVVRIKVEEVARIIRLEFSQNECWYKRQEKKGSGDSIALHQRRERWRILGSSSSEQLIDLAKIARTCRSEESVPDCVFGALLLYNTDVFQRSASLQEGGKAMSFSPLSFVERDALIYYHEQVDFLETLERVDQNQKASRQHFFSSHRLIGQTVSSVSPLLELPPETPIAAEPVTPSPQ